MIDRVFPIAQAREESLDSFLNSVMSGSIADLALGSLTASARTTPCLIQLSRTVGSRLTRIGMRSGYGLLVFTRSKTLATLKPAWRIFAATRAASSERVFSLI